LGLLVLRFKSVEGVGNKLVHGDGLDDSKLPHHGEFVSLGDMLPGHPDQPLLALLCLGEGGVTCVTGFLAAEPRLVGLSFAAEYNVILRCPVMSPC